MTAPFLVDDTLLFLGQPHAGTRPWCSSLRDVTIRITACFLPESCNTILDSWKRLIPHRERYSNEGSVHFMTYKETMTAALFITFLERMLSETTRKIFLIVDRLRAHEAKKVEAWAAEHRDRIELFFLPRYAPERNADEYLNNDMKGSINATGLPGSQEELRRGSRGS